MKRNRHVEILEDLEELRLNKKQKTQIKQTTNTLLLVNNNI